MECYSYIEISVNYRTFVQKSKHIHENYCQKRKRLIGSQFFSIFPNLNSNQINSEILRDLFKVHVKIKVEKFTKKVRN